MGRQDVEQQSSADEFRTFTRALLRDLQALGLMLERGMIETGIRRFGAEQELFLVDTGWRPAMLAMEVLERLPQDGPFTTELGQFNLEFNLDPHVLEGKCFSALHAEIEQRIAEVRAVAADFGADIVLTGILPTLKKSDLAYKNLTPKPRYHALNAAMNRMLNGAPYLLRISGTDDLIVQHDSVMLEACNTSAQIHLQVEAEEFATYYNAAQAVTGPVLAACVNSPLLMGRRLWAETRIALFQQSMDTRKGQVHMREIRPRVRFGEQYVKESVTELFEQDIASFRVMLAAEVDEDPLERLEQGEIPSLQALQLHNSTVYRWNRPCYGVGAGKPHLRIECRVIPSGPTVVDEVANAAFWIGSVVGMAHEHPDVASLLKFDAAKSNFVSAARLGMRAGFYWFGDQSVSASELLTETLIPLARTGLEELGIDSGDINRYMGVIQDRVTSRKTGADWTIHSLAGMEGKGTLSERLAAVTAATVSREKEGRPVHEWDLASIDEAGDWKPSYLTVEQYMTTTLYTVHEDELVELVAFLMNNNKIRHVLVEDDHHDLVGVVSYRSLLRMIANNENPANLPIPVKDIMRRELVTVSPETSTLEAIDLIWENQVSCLPVTSEGKLVGIVTQTDFMPIAYQLLKEKWGES